MNCEFFVGAAPAGCDGCGRPLSGRRVRWCSNKCGATYWANHRYTQARRACLARFAGKKLGRRVVTWICAKCGTHTDKPEVNHIVPARGAHSKISCIHHQENLEALCAPCHRAETRRQREAGELKAA